MKFLFTDEQLKNILDTLVGITIILSATYILTHMYFEATFK